MIVVASNLNNCSSGDRTVVKSNVDLVVVGNIPGLLSPKASLVVTRLRQLNDC